MGDSDLATVYNAVKDVVVLFEDGISQQLTGATALPAGVDASQVRGFAPDTR